MSNGADPVEASSSGIVKACAAEFLSKKERRLAGEATGTFYFKGGQQIQRRRKLRSDAGSKDMSSDEDVHMCKDAHDGYSSEDAGSDRHTFCGDGDVFMRMDAQKVSVKLEVAAGVDDIVGNVGEGTVFKFVKFKMGSSTSF